MTWYLGTVHVRFAAPDGRHPSEAQLDALADALISVRDIVTVRVESLGAPTVYRIDVSADRRAAAAKLATAPLPEIETHVGLTANVLAVGVEDTARRAVGPL